MEEFVIKLHKIDLIGSTIKVWLTPTDGTLNARFISLRIRTERLTEVLALATPTEMFDALRLDIIRGSQGVQADWAAEKAAKAAVIPQELLDAEGAEFPLVTASEITAAMPPKENTISNAPEEI